jgi:trk system potassium uptake protein TrkA
MTIDVLVVGAGRIGVAVAGTLSDGGHAVTIVDPDPARLDQVARDLPAVARVVGSGTDAAILEDAGIRSVDAVAVVTGVDEVNLLAASLARFGFEVPRVVGRIVDPRNGWMYTATMGIDVALDQADLMAQLVVEELSLGEMRTLLKLRRGQFQLVEERVHPAAVAVGTPVRDLPLPPECVLVAVLRGDEVVVVHGSTVLGPGDEVLAVVHSGNASALAALLDGSTRGGP